MSETGCYTPDTLRFDGRRGVPVGRVGGVAAIGPGTAPRQMLVPGKPVLLVLLAVLWLLDSFSVCLGAVEVTVILVRRIAVEDRPLFFKAALPRGAAVRIDDEGKVETRVGDSGLSYVFHFRLLDHTGAQIAEKRLKLSRPVAVWNSLVVTEPYTADYEDKLILQVDASVLSDDGDILAKGDLHERIPRIQDVTGPLRASDGDEEGYPDFSFQVEGDGADGLVSTEDHCPAAEGRIIVHNPFPILADDGKTRQNEKAGAGRRNCLVLHWRGLFDNLNAPFWGKRNRAVSAFMLVVSPSWDLSGSHYLVRDDHELYFAADMLEFDSSEGSGGLYAIDLSSQIKGLDQEKQPFGEGVVSVPLPYDRVGELEIGFLAKDTAFPRPNVTITPLKRFRIEDDIAPHIVLSVQKRKGSRTCETIDACNRAWFRTPLPWALPDELPRKNDSSGGAVAPLTVYAGEPVLLHLFAYDNTRLERDALKITLRTVSQAASHSFGLRNRAGMSPLHRQTLERDAFDPSSARTDVKSPWQMMFERTGRYTIDLEAEDIHGNRRVLSTPVIVRQRTFDVLNISDRESRR